MEEPGEQYTVVFALIVTEPAIGRVCVEGRGGATPPPPRSRFCNSLQYMQRRQCIVFQIPPWPKQSTEHRFADTTRTKL